MKPFVKLVYCIFILSLMISCEKERSCEGCATKNNKPPIAVAGPDQVITLPTDSVLLDGRTSSDPDGSISSYLWTKILGPVSFNILKPSDSLTKLKTLVAGTYQFELKVIDNGGLSAKDTMRVVVDSVLTTNHPPIANAGADQTIILPTNGVNLDGSASSDPENNITSYVWTKIIGPPSFNIANITATQTQVTNLVQGVYQFELKVTDAWGFFSKDTLEVSVNSSSPPTGCNLANRQEINVQMTQIGTLSDDKAGVAVGAVGNKIVFAGGLTESNGSSLVDIYDISLNNWTTAQLSVPRWLIASATCGNKIFFAGGFNTDGASWVEFYNTVDVYDASTNTWSVISLSEGKAHIAATSLGNKVFFGGGYLGGAFQMSNKVESFDITTNQWTHQNLSVARESLTADVMGNKIYFAGGNTGYTNTPNALLAYPTARIDIYDNVTNTWTVDLLNEPKWGHTSIAVGNKIYWAGGVTQASSFPSGFSQKVEIRDISTQNISFDCLFQPNWNFKAVMKSNKIIFFTGSGAITNKFDIYDIATNTWSIGVLPFNINGAGVNSAGIISVNNTIYVAGGSVNGVLSNKVWKLEF